MLLRPMSQDTVPRVLTFTVTKRLLEQIMLRRKRAAKFMDGLTVVERRLNFMSGSGFKCSG